MPRSLSASRRLIRNGYRAFKTVNTADDRVACAVVMILGVVGVWLCAVQGVNRMLVTWVVSLLVNVEVSHEDIKIKNIELKVPMVPMVPILPWGDVGKIPGCYPMDDDVPTSRGLIGGHIDE